MNAAGVIGQVRASADRVFTLLDTPAPVLERRSGPIQAPVEPSIRMSGVRFGYDERTPVLDGLDLDIPAGQTVALTGPSGAGKSTCLHLLLRFWSPQAGQVTIGGHDIRELPEETLHGFIAYVPQDVYLFNDTVAANIRLGRPGAADAEVEAAARQAVAHDFITALPQGYDTIVGEHGRSLSGGERQRIAIARAFLKDAPILLMDEPVADLDAHSEHQLNTAMRHIRTGRTVLLVAHRHSTARTADRIFVLDRNRIVQSGTPAELADGPGAYKRLMRPER